MLQLFLSFTMSKLSDSTGTIQLLSHIVQGLGPPSKCIKVFNYYKSLGADIVALQETHFASSFIPPLYA